MTNINAKYIPVALQLLVTKNVCKKCGQYHEYTSSEPRVLLINPDDKSNCSVSIAEFIDAEREIALNYTDNLESLLPTVFRSIEVQIPRCHMCWRHSLKVSPQQDLFEDAEDKYTVFTPIELPTVRAARLERKRRAEEQEKLAAEKLAKQQQRERNREIKRNKKKTKIKAKVNDNGRVVSPYPVENIRQRTVHVPINLDKLTTDN